MPAFSLTKTLKALADLESHTAFMKAPHLLAIPNVCLNNMSKFPITSLILQLTPADFVYFGYSTYPQ